MTHREVLAKTLVWRIIFSIPLGVFITWLWVGNLWKSFGLMIFLHLLYTVIHYYFEKTFWPKFWQWSSIKLEARRGLNEDSF